MTNQIVKVNTKVVISELHRAFKMFNEKLFKGELPEPAILIQSRGNKKLTLGWCTVGKVWKNEYTHEERYEINLVAEALNRGIYPVMATLLHEMVHLHNLVNNIKDTSRGNTYHNMKFKTMAEEHGLNVEHADKIGWSVTTLQPTTMALIDDEQFDEAVFSFARKSFEEGEKPKKKKTSSRKYVCPICGTTIRASKDVLVLCGICTDVENGKVVPMVKEVAEGEEGAEPSDSPTIEPVEPIEEEPTEVEAPIETPVEEDAPKAYKQVCKDCGSIFEVDDKLQSCIECEGELVTLKAPTETTEAPVEIVEVDDELLNGEGELVPVKQGMFKINKKWTAEDIMEILEDARKQAEGFGYDAPAIELPIEVSEKMVAQFAQYKEGKKFTFSKGYLEEASSEAIIDTVKHQYLHHMQFINEGLKVNHRKEFKDLCEQFGLETKVPSKNHRAMK